MSVLGFSSALRQTTHLKKDFRISKNTIRGGDDGEMETLSIFLGKIRDYNVQANISINGELPNTPNKSKSDTNCAQTGFTFPVCKSNLLTTNGKHVEYLHTLIFMCALFIRCVRSILLQVSIGHKVI